jgi:mRNA-degrading endonuclease RelE of RelBE toxin-antitoxin system
VSYRVEILRRAAKALSQLPTEEYERVPDAIRHPGSDPRPPVRSWSDATAGGFESVAIA